MRNIRARTIALSRTTKNNLGGKPSKKKAVTPTGGLKKTSGKPAIHWNLGVRRARYVVANSSLKILRLSEDCAYCGALLQ